MLKPILTNTSKGSHYARLIKEGYKTEEIRKFVPKGFIGWVYIIRTVSKVKWITDEIWGDKYPLWIGYKEELK